MLYRANKKAVDRMDQLLSRLDESADGQRPKGTSALAWASACRPAHGFAATFFSETLLEASLFARLQVEAILFNVFANAFPLHFTAETAEGLFKWLIFTNSDENHDDSRDQRYN